MRGTQFNTALRIVFQIFIWINKKITAIFSSRIPWTHPWQSQFYEECRHHTETKTNSILPLVHSFIPFVKAIVILFKVCFRELSLRCMLSRLITLLLVSSLSLISTYHAFSQQGAIVFQHLDAESGLSHSDVNCITQDKKGFIWIGTKKGLDRYDGHFVKSFKNLLIKPNDYQDDEITCSFEDHSGKLWFGTTGLLWYDPQLKKYHIYRKGDGCALPSNDIISIVEDENHKLWVATRRGLCGFHEGNHNFITFLHDTTGNTQEVYLSNRITAIIPDGKGNLWIGSLSGLYTFTLSSRQFSSNLLEKCNSHIPP